MKLKVFKENNTHGNINKNQFNFKSIALKIKIKYTRRYII